MELYFTEQPDTYSSNSYHHTRTSEQMSLKTEIFSLKLIDEVRRVIEEHATKPFLIGYVFHQRNRKHQVLQ